MIDYATRVYGDVVSAVIHVMVVFLLLSIPATGYARFPGQTPVALDTQIHATMKAAYNPAPFSGFLPVRIHITNNSGKDRSWHFKAINGDAYGRTRSSSTFAQELTVPAQEEKVFELYVPILSIVPVGSARHYGGQYIRMELSGYGIRTVTLRGHTNKHRFRKKTLPFIAMSPSLHLRSWPVFSKAFETEGYTMTGSRIEPSNMPTSWRGYAGLGALLISEPEWAGLSATVRSAVIDWVLMGGRLHIFHRGALPQGRRDYGGFRFERVEGSSAEASLGLGQVALFIWDGREIGLEYQKNLIPGQENHNHRPLLENYNQAYTRSSWPLADRMPEVRFSTAFLVVLTAFLLIYFVLVGPLNIRVFTRQEGRLILFLTTPVFAAACSIVLCILLAVHAGFGGWGLRTTGVYLPPNAKKAVVMQEQTARTALIASTDFTVGKDLFMTPIRFAEGFGKEVPRYKLSAQHFSGDWFANNAIQAQFIELLQPTRAGIEILAPLSEATRPAHQLTVLSSINAVLKDLYVRDAGGNYWHGSNIAAGHKAELRKVSRRHYVRWRKDALDTYAGPQLRQTLRHIWRQHSVFLAVAQSDPGFAVETLPAIDWKEHTIILFGHMPSARTVDSAGTFILQTASLLVPPRQADTQTE